jgi:hypothetical protein
MTAVLPRNHRSIAQGMLQHMPFIIMRKGIMYERSASIAHHHPVRICFLTNSGAARLPTHV